MIEWIIVGIALVVLLRYSTSLNGYLAFDQQLTPRVPKQVHITVLIPFKNEADHLPALINSLQHQSYDLKKVQFLFIDDHSTDHSAEFVKSSIHQFPNAFYVLNNSRGKKQAILSGVEQAQNDWILMTDGDSIPNPQWMATMTGFIQEEKEFITGPIELIKENGWLYHILTAEHFALQQLTRLSIAKQSPLMANGANMLFQKNLVQKAFTDKTLSYASGDDSNLLFAAWKHKANSVAFANSMDAAVKTKASTTLTDAINQRVRWASKLKKYEFIPHVTNMGWIIALANLIIPILTISSIKSVISGLILLGYLIFKTWIDYRFIRDCSENLSFGKQFLVTILYPFFFLSVLCLSLLKEPKKLTNQQQKW